jgi:hypothetical protein
VSQEVFPMWFAYISVAGQRMFFMALPRDYISSTEQNGNRENENENGASPWHSRKKGSDEV